MQLWNSIRARWNPFPLSLPSPHTPTPTPIHTERDEIRLTFGCGGCVSVLLCCAAVDIRTIVRFGNHPRAHARALSLLTPLSLSLSTSRKCPFAHTHPPTPNQVRTKWTGRNVRTGRSLVFASRHDLNLYGVFACVRVWRPGRPGRGGGQWRGQWRRASIINRAPAVKRACTLRFWSRRRAATDVVAH